ncbi:MAG: maleylpyruvate isomerase N-terminal domain-containing protein [Actinomycetota bacterium]
MSLYSRRSGASGGTLFSVNGYSVLDASYQALLRVVSALDDDTGWRNTRCTGWTVRDLIHHLLADAQRALVALHTPSSGSPDVDAISYWKPWQPGTPGAEAGRRGTRIMASAWSSVEPIAAAYVETASAVLVAGRERRGEDLVATQGHVITVDALFRTLAVEATVHHLDLRLGKPSQAGLAETRRVLDGLLGHRGPIADSSRYVLIGTGREPLTGEEADALGADAERLPLFG